MRHSRITSTAQASPGRGSKGATASETRARIVEAAARLYRTAGHRKTTVADIARDLSMSPANLYRFFPSRQAIETAVVGELLDQVGRAVRAAACSEGPATERLRRVLHAAETLHARRRTEDPRLHELVVTATSASWPIATSYADRLNSTLAQLVSEGQARGEFADGDAMLMADCLLSATTAYLDPRSFRGSATSGRPAFEVMLEFCIGALRAVPGQTVARFTARLRG